MRKKNIFIVGLDDFNLKQLQALPNADQYTFHELFQYRQVQGPEALPLPELLDRCQEKLEAFSEPIDAICGYWDFPVTNVVAILTDRFGLPGPTLESVLKCEHKYWSRVEQARVIPDHVPDFEAVDPFDDHPIDNLSIEYPFWLKPIKSFSSYLGFRINNDEDFHHAIGIIRRKMGELSKPFNHLLARADIPEEIRKVNGEHCIAERIITGEQCTVEGYAVRGSVQTYGIIDSVRYPNGSTFSRYQYPSRLPLPLRRKLGRITRKIIRRIGLNQSAFNIEYFINAYTGQIWLLEINPRISQSHSDLFEKVDGVSNHHVTVELALGREPRLPQRGGKYKQAAKLFVRKFEDAYVRSIPDPQRIQQVTADIPDTHVKLNVKEGMRLSDLYGQDSYSYELASIFMGADTEQELLDRYQRCVESLPFEFSS